MTLTDASASASRSAPVRCPGVELLGQLEGSGYRQAPGLVRRPSGQTVQVTALLYQLLEAIDGQRNLDELAEILNASSAKTLTAEDVAFLLDEKLEPLGLIGEGLHDEDHTPSPLLSLKPKVVVSDPAVTATVTAPFARLFRPVIVLPVLAVFAVTCWWVLWREGLAAGTRQAFDSPGLLLGVFVLTIISAGWHEFGHAAACRAKGATPGAMGAGLYLVWPAFYTDVTDSYRLKRWGRLVVDLGGLYFNALAAVAAMTVWLVSRQHVVLLVVAMQLLLMLRQLAPIVRADGYHILADLTGVPDLFHHIKPTLAGLLPTNWGKPQPLRPWARWIVRTWVLIVVPLLVWILVLGVLLLPRLIATAWVSLKDEVRGLTQSGEGWDVLGLLASALQVVALLLPIAAILYQLVRISRRAGRSVWQRTDGRPVARALAVIGTVALLALLAFAWWPSGQYQPVAANERGTLGDTVRMARPTETTDIQARVAPRTAYALVPRGGGTTLLLMRDEGGAVQGILTDGDEAGVAFPFALPAPPGPGDNQALAVNTGDGTTVYDIAVSLVWVTDGDPSLNRNEAYALASCTDCTTVAVAFQVVLIIGQSDAIAPVNAALAANGGCVRCTTTALAMQLVLTLQELPEAELQRQIEDAVGRAEGLADSNDPLAYLQSIQTEVVGLLVDAGLVEDVASTGAVATTVASTSTTRVATTIADSPATTASPESTTTSAAPTTTAAVSTTTSSADGG